MTGAVIAVPLRVEWAALRGLRTPIRLTGMGPRRSRRFARGLGDRAVLVAGVGGGLSRQLRAGDLVVATEVRAGDGAAVTCPWASWLAERLRGLGVTVHCGPIASRPRPVSGALRQRLAATGAVAVDMESAWLAPSGGGAFAVVRSISDTGRRSLLHPAMLRDGLVALRSLRAAAPALDAWADAVRLGEAPAVRLGEALAVDPQLDIQPPEEVS